MKKYKSLLIYLLVFGLAILLVYKALVTQIPDLWPALKSGNEADIEKFLMDSDRWTGLISLGMLQFIQVISIVIPSIPIQIAGGMVYGALRGFIICHLANVFAHFCVIVGVRKFSGISEIIGEKNRVKLQETMKTINQGDPYVTIMLLCMIPAVPNGIIPYAASQMDIRIKDFTKAVWLGSLYPILSLVLAGRFILMGDYHISGALIIMNLIVLFILYKRRLQISEWIVKQREERKAKRKARQK